METTNKSETSKLKENASLAEQEVNEENGYSDAENEEKMNPLMMEDILDFVFLRLDMKSLKIARQVNKIWKELAMKRMLKIGFIFKTPSRFYKMSKSGKAKELNIIKSFVSCKKNTIQALELSREEDAQVLKSLDIRGSEVKELKCPFSLIITLGPQVVKRFVNLAHFTDSTNLLINPLSILTYFDSTKPLLFSPGIRIESNAGLFDIHEIFSTRKIKGKKIEYNGNLLNDPTDWPRMARILYQICKNSRDTLEELFISCQMGFLPGFQFPVMSNVKKFECLIFPPFDRRVNWNPHLLSNFRFVEHFPNLNQLELYYYSTLGSEFGTECFDVWVRAFVKAGKALKVKTVKCFLGWDMSTDVLASIFPNAKIIFQN